MMKCEKCSNQDSVLKVNVPVVNDKQENIALCLGCRVRIYDVDIFPQDNPQISITKKLDITLSEEDWQWINNKSMGNESRYLRSLILHSKKFAYI